MSEQTYERKKDFVNHALSRCVAAMYPNVCGWPTTPGTPTRGCGRPP